MIGGLVCAVPIAVLVSSGQSVSVLAHGFSLLLTGSARGCQRIGITFILEEANDLHRLRCDGSIDIEYYEVYI